MSPGGVAALVIFILVAVVFLGLFVHRHQELGRLWALPFLVLPQTCTNLRANPSSVKKKYKYLFFQGLQYVTLILIP
jgi:hypothetical protein